MFNGRYEQSICPSGHRESMIPGRSIRWNEVFQKLTGERGLNASALIEYFAPLYEWLREENRRTKERPGWSLEGCPPAQPSPFFSPSSPSPFQRPPEANRSPADNHRGMWVVVGGLVLVFVLKVLLVTFVVLLRRRRRARKLSRAPFKDKQRHESAGTDGPENSFGERDSPEDISCKGHTRVVTPLVQLESVL